MRIVPLLAGGLLLMAGCGTEPTTPLNGYGLLAGTCDTENGGKALHWAPGDACIPVTYEPELEPERANLERALEAWSKLDCSRLCFEAPAALARDPEQEVVGAIHFVEGVPDPRIPIYATITYHQDSFMILGSVIRLDPELLAAIPADQVPGAWAGAVGHALGLDAIEDDVRSVRAHVGRHLAPEPTERDQADFCAIYGAGGVCALTP